MPNHFDIAVIGAGPAGTACALALRDSGLKVVLIDKGTFPRDKICGDAIPGPAFKAMNAINTDWGMAMRAFADTAKVRRSKGFMPNGKSVSVAWKGFSYNSKRVHFDSFLLGLVKTETNTTILENKRLKAITQNTDDLICQFQDNSTLTASLVIGCDGANSIVGRQLGHRDVKDHPPCVAVRAYYKGIEGLQADTNEFHFFKELMPGYFWIFPLDNGWANVGFGLLTSKKDQAEEKNLRDTLQHAIANYPSLAPRFKHAEMMDGVKGFALPLATSQRAISGNRYMLCGDAASLIDPLWGHGIDSAMYSGLMAAEQAIKCFQQNDFTAGHIKQYDAAVNAKYSNQFGNSRRVLNTIGRFPFLLNLLGYSQPLVDRWW